MAKQTSLKPSLKKLHLACGSGAALVGALFLLSTVACGTLNKMGKVADKTDEMNQTTKGMAEETKKMREETEKMRADTERMRQETEKVRAQTEAAATAGNRAADAGSKAADAGSRAADNSLIAAKAGQDAAAAGLKAATVSQDIYRDSRQGDGVTVRSQRLEAMNSHADVESKIAEAGVFFKAFEFQLWKNQNFDTLEKREVLFEEGVLSFFRESHAYVDYDKKFDVSSSDNKELNLMALAVSAHLLNSTQEELVEKSQRVSMFDLIKQALALKQKVESGELATSELLPWQKSVLEKEKEAVMLLQARANFPVAMALSKISKVNSTSVWGLSGLFAKITNLMGTWQPDLASQNQVQLDAYSKWLDIAVQSRDFLESNGFDPATDQRLVKMLRNIDRNSSSFADVTALKKSSIQTFFSKALCFTDGICKSPEVSN